MQSRPCSLKSRAAGRVSSLFVLTCRRKHEKPAETAQQFHPPRLVDDVFARDAVFAHLIRPVADASIRPRPHEPTQNRRSHEPGGDTTPHFRDANERLPLDRPSGDQHHKRETDGDHDLRTPSTQPVHCPSFCTTIRCIAVCGVACSPPRFPRLRRIVYSMACLQSLLGDKRAQPFRGIHDFTPDSRCLMIRTFPKLGAIVPYPPCERKREPFFDGRRFSKPGRKFAEECIYGIRISLRRHASGLVDAPTRINSRPPSVHPCRNLFG